MRKIIAGPLFTKSATLNLSSRLSRRAVERAVEAQGFIRSTNHQVEGSSLCERRKSRSLVMSETLHFDRNFP
jgi:hypothetical protein